MNWYRAKEICGNCRDDYDCTEADMRCCCKLCRFLGNDDRCDECRPVEEAEE